jgi:hypothetical protein
MKRAALAAALCALAGCSVPMQTVDASRAACASYGFQPGSDAFAADLRRRPRSRRRCRSARVGAGPVGRRAWSAVGPGGVAGGAGGAWAGAGPGWAASGVGGPP